MFKKGTFTRKEFAKQARFLKARTRKKKSLSTRVKKIEKTIKKEVTFKFHNIDGTIEPDNVLATATNVHFLTPIPQGSSEITRDGRFAFIKSIELRGKVLQVGTSDIGFIRIIIFWARDVNNTLPVLDELIIDPPTALNTLAHRNKDRQNDFVIHYDKIFRLTNTIANIENDTYMHFYKRLNHKISWDVGTTSGLIATARDGHWFLAAISDVAAAAAPSFQYNFRFHYTDA